MGSISHYKQSSTPFGAGFAFCAYIYILRFRFRRYSIGDLYRFNWVFSFSALFANGRVMMMCGEMSPVKTGRFVFSLACDGRNIVSYCRMAVASGRAGEGHREAKLLRNYWTFLLYQGHRDAVVACTSCT